MVVVVVVVVVAAVVVVVAAVVRAMAGLEEGMLVVVAMLVMAGMMEAAMMMGTTMILRAMGQITIIEEILAGMKIQMRGRIMALISMMKLEIMITKEKMIDHKNEISLNYKYFKIFYMISRILMLNLFDKIVKRFYYKSIRNQRRNLNIYLRIEFSFLTLFY